MPDRPGSLRDRLPELEPLDPTYHARYQQALQAMLEKRLPAAGRWLLVGTTLLSLGIAVYLGTLAAVKTELRPLARLGIAGGAVFALGWVALGVWILRRGTFDVKAHPAVMAVLTWVMAVFLVTFALVLAPQAPDPNQGLLAALGGLTILVGAGVGFLGARIQQAELRTREWLLGVEYRLAQLAEELTRKQRK